MAKNALFGASRKRQPPVFCILSVKFGALRGKSGATEGCLTGGVVIVAEERANYVASFHRSDCEKNRRHQPAVFSGFG